MKNYFTLFVIGLLFSSCVSSKIFNEIESRYAKLKLDHTTLEKENAQLIINYDSLRYHLGTLENENKQLGQSLATTSNTLANLQEAYTALEQNSSTALQESIEKNNGLLEQIQIKESELLADRNRLDSLKKELGDRIVRVEELEGLIAEKEQLMNALKNSLSEALLSFEGNGLSVVQKNGKVYVSMENKLLFVQ